MKTIYQLAGLTVALCTIAGTAHAETIKDSVGPGDSDSRWVVGGTLFSVKNIYAGESNEEGFLPSVQYKGERFFVKDGSINYSIKQMDNLTFGVTARASGSFLSDNSNYRKNTQLTGLAERDGTIDGGFYVNHTTDLGRMHFSLVTDLGSEHDGQTASLNYTFDLTAGKWNINPSIGAQWQSGDVVDHYFGVSDLESTATRAAYNGSSSINLFAGVRARYEITDHWDFSASTGVTRYGDGITDSSIVDEDYSYFSTLSVNYNF